MAQTAKYCDDCLSRLNPATAKSPEEKAFLNAHQFHLGSQPDYSKGPKTEYGQCDKCGKEAVLTYYEISN